MGNVLTLASGTAMAQVVTLCFAPIVTRLYAPSSFGVQGTFMALVSVCAPLAALSYPVAIVLPKDDREARGLVRLSWVAAAAVAVLLALVLLVAFRQVVGLFQLETIAPYLYLLPVVILLSAGQQIDRQWLIRKQNFAATASAGVLQAVLTNAGKAAVGLFNSAAANLIVLNVAGIGLNALLLNLSARKHRPAPGPSGGAAPLAPLARAHADFPKYRAPEMLINAVSEGLPVLMLANAFGPFEAGLFALARSVLYLPLTLIGASVADVFYPRFNTELNARGRLTFMLGRSMLALAAIGVPILGIVAVAGPWLFSLAFGSKWLEAGEYARWMTIWLLPMLINRPCVGATSVLGMQRIFLLHGIFTLALRFAALFLAIRWFAGALPAVIGFSAAGAISCLVLVWLVWASARRQERAFR